MDVGFALRSFVDSFVRSPRMDSARVNVLPLIYTQRYVCLHVYIIFFYIWTISNMLRPEYNWHTAFTIESSVSAVWLYSIVCTCILCFMHHYYNGWISVAITAAKMCAQRIDWDGMIDFLLAAINLDRLEPQQQQKQQIKCICATYEMSPFLYTYVSSLVPSYRC